MRGDAFNAAVYPLPALVVFVGLIGMGAWVTRRLLTADFPERGTESPSWSLEKTSWRWSLVVWSILFFLAGIPLSVLIWRAGMQRHFDGEHLTLTWSGWSFTSTLFRTGATMQDDFLGTFKAGALAATLSTILAVVLAWWSRQGGWKFIVVLILATLLLATPGPLIGVAVIKFLNNPAIPGFTYLYDRTIAAPALAQAARALPFVLFIAWHALAKFDRGQQEAAALDGYGPWGVLWRVVLPQRWRALVAAWGLALAIGVGDVTCSLLVLPPGLDTVARRLFGDIHSGVDDRVAAACLLVMLLAAAIGAIFLRLITGPQSLVFRRKTDERPLA
jgi:iron(III) transport system permease protein